MGIALSGLGHRVETVMTTGPGSATWQAQGEVEAGADLIFACGGDGTIHEVVQGLVSELGEPRAALGVLSFGSHNSLARHLRLPSDPVAAALKQIQGVPSTVPIGKVVFGRQTRYFILMAGAGPDGALAQRLHGASKSCLGRASYYAHAAKLFASRHFAPFEVEVVNEANGIVSARQAVGVMAVRVSDLGGMFRGLAGGRASLHDPHLSLLLLRPPAFLSLPLWFVSAWLGLHRLNPFLEIVKAQSCTLHPQSSAAPLLQADGEWVGQIPAKFSIVTNALRLAVASEATKLMPILRGA